MKRTAKWNDLSSGQRTAASVAIGVEVVLTTTALVQLVRLPAAEVRGPKALWALVCFVQPVGPIIFLAWGTRRR